MFSRYELAARADADDLAKAIADIPSCSLSCLATAAASVNCDANDFACQCKNPPDFGAGSSTAACIVKACKLIDSTTTGLSFGRVCIIVRRSPNSTSSSSITSSSTLSSDSTAAAPTTTTTLTTISPPPPPPPAVAASTSESLISASPTLSSSSLIVPPESTVVSSSSSVLETISSTTSQLVSSSSLTSIQETSLAISSPTSTAISTSSSQSSSAATPGMSQAQVNISSNTTNRVVVPVVIAATVAFVTAIIIVLSVIWLRKRHSRKAQEGKDKPVAADKEEKGRSAPPPDMGELYLADTIDETEYPKKAGGRSIMPQSIHSDISRENLLITEAALLGNIREQGKDEAHYDHDHDDMSIKQDFMSDEDMKRMTRLHSEWFMEPPPLASHPIEKGYISPERERTTHIAETLHHPGLDQVPPLSPAKTEATTNSITDSEFGKIGAAITAYILSQPESPKRATQMHSRFSVSTVNTSAPAPQQ